MKGLFRYWGYGLLLIVVGGWITKDVGPLAILVASLICSFYFLFQAPMWCGAITRDDKHCRKNSYGLLVGCSHRQHKWQSFKLLVNASRWGELGRKALQGLGAQAASISALAAVASALFAGVTLLVT